MTNNKLGIVLGAFTLAVAAFLSTKASKNTTAGLSAYYTISSMVVTLFKGMSASVLNLTTIKIPGRTFFIRTGISSSDHRVFADHTGGSLIKTLFVKHV